jgi:predicted nucleic acid-binding protein
MMRGKVCFVDSSAFIALNHVSDQHFEEAAAIAAQLGGYRFLVSDAVITETYTLLRYKLGFHTANRFLTAVLDSGEYEIAEVTPVDRRLAAQWLVKFNDHKLSYCDALSASIMKHRDIEKIFAFDHHFELMGFTRLTAN